VPQLRVKLIGKRTAKDTLSARTSASGIATLHAEIFNETVECKSIIIAVLTQLYEVLTCFGNKIGMDEKGKVA
jgi:hypothetical protein